MTAIWTNRHVQDHAEIPPRKRNKQTKSKIKISVVLKKKAETKLIKTQSYQLPSVGSKWSMTGMCNCWIPCFLYSSMGPQYSSCMFSTREIPNFFNFATCRLKTLFPSHTLLSITSVQGSVRYPNEYNTSRQTFHTAKCNLPQTRAMGEGRRLFRNSCFR